MPALAWIAGHLGGRAPSHRDPNHARQRTMAMARREFAAVLRSIKRCLQLIVAALLILMDSFDEASRALEEQRPGRSIVQKKRRDAGGFEVWAMNVTRRAHKEMEQRCHSNMI